MAGERDSRVVVGGAVWARAEAISHDYKRILGNQFKTKWIQGVVVRAEKRKASEKAKRATTYVTGKYPCGEDGSGNKEYKVKELTLGTLKDKDPSTIADSVAANGPPPPTLTAVAAPAAAAAPDAPTANVPATNAPTANVPATDEPTTPEEGAPPRNEHPPPSTQETAQSNSTTTTSSTASTRIPVATSNGRDWFDGDTKVDVNGKHSSRFWRGHEFTPGCDRSKDPRYRPIDYFMACFPKTQLQEMEERTSEVLVNAFPEPLPPTTIGELLKFFGILVIITRFEFGKRLSLWTDTAHTRFVPPPNLGHTTGMSRHRLISFGDMSYGVFNRRKGPVACHMKSGGGHLSRILSITSTVTERSSSVHRGSYVLMNLSADGTDWEALGSISAYPCMLQWIESQSMVAKYRIAAMLCQELCCG